MIQEIRTVCGIAEGHAAAAADEIPDDVAEDVRVGDGTSHDDEIEEFHMELA